MNPAEIIAALKFAATDAALKLRDHPDAGRRVVNAIRRDPLWPAFVQIVQDDIIVAGTPLTGHLVALANREPTEGLTEHALWNLFVHEF